VREKDHITGAHKTVANRSFEPSGRLCLRAWFREHNQPSRLFADSDQEPLESLLVGAVQGDRGPPSAAPLGLTATPAQHSIKQQRWDEIFAKAK
jgi:hypothetical protein